MWNAGLSLTTNQRFRLGQIACGELERDQDGATYLWSVHDWNDRIVDPDIDVLAEAGLITLVDGPTISGGRVRWDVTDKALEA